MNHCKFLFPVLLFIIAVPSVSGKKALRNLRTANQPDGTSIQYRVVGDENLHFTISQDGNLLCVDPDGFYRLATINNEGNLVSTGILPDDPRASSVAVKLKDIDLKALLMKTNVKRRAPQSGYGLMGTNYPTTGNPKGLIILVEYSDVKFKSMNNYNGKEYFNNMINGENFSQFGATGSARQYFREQSSGKFVPDFDVLGPITLPNNQAYYGKNDREGYDMNAHLMVQDAVNILDQSVDFSQYDTDHNGVLDNIYIYYAGQGEADFGAPQTVWPHSWDLRYTGISMTVDNVIVGPYACSNEWADKTPDGVGTFIHEFSHVMGLPDLYHTEDEEAEYTPDAYSVMDYGPYNNNGRTPPNYSAFEKNAMGWFEPITLDRPMSVTLDEISSGQFGLIPTEKETEFFLLENRQQTGWDTFIPNHGMLIWHIDYVKRIFDRNEVNNRENHQYVDIVEANNNPGFDNLSGYTFPGTTGKTSFTSETSPALKSWSGADIDLPVTNITEKNGIISFDVAGGNNSEAGNPAIANENSNEPAIYYNLQGIKIDHPSKGTVLLKKEGNKVVKIIK